jgi:voltage-gated sodium channel
MTDGTVAAVAPWRSHLLRLTDSGAFSRAVIALIIANAVILGLETFPSVMARYGAILIALDRAILVVFVIELSLRIAAHGRRFFIDAWSLFDLAVVLVSLAPASEAFSVLRAMRVLRVLRLISAFPQLRRVLQGFAAALPSLGSISAILAIFFYVFAVMAAKLFGTHYPQWFGGLFEAIFTLFQIMTLEGWADIVREVEKTHPYAGLFFVAFILLSTFTVLNMLIAVVVDAMNKVDAVPPEAKHDAVIADEISALNRKLDLLLSQKLMEDGNQHPHPLKQ